MTCCIIFGVYYHGDGDPLKINGDHSLNQSCSRTQRDSRTRVSLFKLPMEESNGDSIIVLDETRWRQRPVW